MKFIIDAQLSPSLVVWFQGRGHDATHVCETDGLTSNDRAIWQFASTSSSIIVIKDKDFARFRRQATGPQILLMRAPNCTNRELFKLLDVNWQSILLKLTNDMPIVEVG